MSAPASSASVRASPPAKTAIFTSLPVPFGKETVLLIFCSASFGSIPKEKEASIDSSNFADATSLQILIASDFDCLVSDIFSLACVYFFPCFFHLYSFGSSDFNLPNITSL